MGTILFLSLYYLLTVYTCTYLLIAKSTNTKTTLLIVISELLLLVLQLVFTDVEGPSNLRLLNPSTHNILKESRKPRLTREFHNQNSKQLKRNPPNGIASLVERHTQRTWSTLSKDISFPSKHTYYALSTKNINHISQIPNNMWHYYVQQPNKKRFYLMWIL